MRDDGRTLTGLTYPFNAAIDRVYHTWPEALASARKLAARNGCRYIVRRKSAGWGADRWWAVQRMREGSAS